VSEGVPYEAPRKNLPSKIQALEDAEVLPHRRPDEGTFAMLEKEISDWPGVSRRPMFGYQGLYRDGQIFAALPDPAP